MSSSLKLGIVFLHGSGGNGAELRSYLDTISLPAERNQTFNDIVLKRFGWLMTTPTAAKRPYSAAHGESTNVWFDREPSFVRDGVDGTYEDVEGANAAVDKIWECVAELDERSAGRLDAVVVGGFSMGGSAALHTLRCYCSHNLAPHQQQAQATQEHPAGLRAVSPRLLSLVRGLFMISNYLVHSSAVFGALQAATAAATIPSVAGAAASSSSNSSTPVPYPSVLVLHGTDDDLIPLPWGRATATELMLASSHTVQVQFREYSAGEGGPGTVRGGGSVRHEIVPAELEDLLDWMRFQMLPTGSGSSSSSSGSAGDPGNGAIDEDDDDELRSDGKSAEELVREEEEEEEEDESKDYKPTAAATGQAAKDSAIADDDDRVAQDRRRWQAGLAERKEAHYQQLRQQQQQQQQVQVQQQAKATSSSAATSTAAGGSPPPPIPYELEVASTGGGGKVRIVYLFPSRGSHGSSSSGSSSSSDSEFAENIDTVAANLAGIASRPIFACGGCFDLRPHPKGLETVVTSADPHRTAVEIGKRLLNRINTGSKDMNPCAMQ